MAVLTTNRMNDEPMLSPADPGRFQRALSGIRKVNALYLNGGRVTDHEESDPETAGFLMPRRDGDLMSGRRGRTLPGDFLSDGGSGPWAPTPIGEAELGYRASPGREWGQGFFRLRGSRRLSCAWGFRIKRRL